MSNNTERNYFVDEASDGDGFLVNDRQDRRAYIEAEHNLHPRVAFDYRPVAPVELEVYRGKLERLAASKSDRASIEMTANMIKSKVTWWSRPENIDISTLSKINPVLFRKIEATILGAFPSDPPFDDMPETSMPEASEAVSPAETEKN